jgi:hypothetical protein
VKQTQLRAWLKVNQARSGKTLADNHWVSGWFITDLLCVTFLIVMITYTAVAPAAVTLEISRGMGSIRLEQSEE